MGYAYAYMAEEETETQTLTLTVTETGITTTATETATETEITETETGITETETAPEIMSVTETISLTVVTQTFSETATATVSETVLPECEFCDAPYIMPAICNVTVSGASGTCANTNGAYACSYLAACSRRSDNYPGYPYVLVRLNGIRLLQVIVYSSAVNWSSHILDTPGDACAYTGNVPVIGFAGTCHGLKVTIDSWA